MVCTYLYSLHAMYPSGNDFHRSMINILAFLLIAEKSLRLKVNDNEMGTDIEATEEE